MSCIKKENQSTVAAVKLVWSVTAQVDTNNNIAWQQIKIKSPISVWR